MKGHLHIGTSGWQYKHWLGNFYPQDMKKTPEQFKHYLKYFDTVELNNPFYKLPKRETFESWRKSASKDFIFAVKANRFITHMKKLKDFKEPMQRMMDSMSGLQKKLGPVLFQLPPGWKVNMERLSEFVKALPKKIRFAFEFRNETWYTEEVYKLLEKYNCAFCIYELAGHQSPIKVTADFVYLRLHGPTKNKYQGSYDDKTLRMWSEYCKNWRKEKKDVYVYFDNDQAGYAAFNAIRMKEMSDE